jgi:hypothetical protein
MTSAMLAGGALIVLGILGATGLFPASTLLSVLHALLGTAGLVVARTPPRAYAYLVGAGVALLALWLLGLARAGDWIPLNTTANWIHLGLGVALLALARATSRP